MVVVESHDEDGVVRVGVRAMEDLRVHLKDGVVRVRAMAVKDVLPLVLPPCRCCRRRRVVAVNDE